MAVDLPKMGPLRFDDEVVGLLCQACTEPFEPGDRVTIVPLGPGPDREERRAARDGRPYNGVGVAVHWSCATGEEGER